MAVSDRHAKIRDTQRREIERLASDAAFAAACGAEAHYSTIGCWPGAKPGARVLELGCGPGRYVALLASLGCKVTGADPLPFDTWPLVEAHRAVEFVSGVKAEALPFGDGAFDGVACLGALLYFDDPKQALAEIRRVLVPGGQLILRTVNRRNLYTLLRGSKLDPASKNLYTMSELAALVESAGFEVTATSSYGFYSPVFPNYWWYLINGRIPMWAQRRLSAMTPQRLHTNLTLFARLAG